MSLAADRTAIWSVMGHPGGRGWNAAKRVLSMGHTNVAWYPEGTDGWTDALLPVVDAQPAPAVGE